MVGVFSDLDSVAAGLNVSIEADSRFTSSPSVIKTLAMILGALTAVVSLFALHRLDNRDGRGTRKFLPARWWKFTVLDGVVVGTLVLWHFIGATTTDDGYQFTMARASEQSGYMSNYFRWFAVPETPFGTPYYNILGLLAHVSTASPWVRLPALLAGIITWLVISREVGPRLGAAIRGNRLALWTGALVFLAFWLPFNNGLRPEPIVALGVLLTWCSIERAVATRRLLPVAIAILIAGFTLTAALPDSSASPLSSPEYARSCASSSNVPAPPVTSRLSGHCWLPDCRSSSPRSVIRVWPPSSRCSVSTRSHRINPGSTSISAISTSSTSPSTVP
ncbi:hypothetical protein GCM10020255_086870 [Rhodococcus baikonurensis]